MQDATGLCMPAGCFCTVARDTILSSGELFYISGRGWTLGICVVSASEMRTCSIIYSPESFTLK